MATVPHDFIGPLRPGTTREPEPGFSSADPELARGEQISAGEYTKKRRRSSKKKKTVPSEFVGPIQKDVTREPAPEPEPAPIPTSRKITPAKDTKLIPTETSVQERYFKTTPDIIYKDSLGYSVRPEERKRFVNDFEKQTGSISATPDPRTEWSVDIAPPEKQKFKESVKKKGYITGTLDYASDWFKSTHDYWQQKAGYYGGLDVTELAGDTLRISPYFAPGGGYIFMGEGFEGLTSKEGKDIIKQSRTKYRESGLGPGTSSTLAVAPNLAMIGLGFVSSPLFGKTRGFVSTLGRSEVKVADLTSAEVIAGTKTFPTAPPETHLDKFKARGKGYHAYSNPWKTTTTQAGTSELPGTYISTEVSPYFLRTGAGESKSFNFLDYLYGDVISGVTKPGVMEITPKGFRAGRFSKTTGGKNLGYKWTATEKYGVAEVPGMKTEIEAILRPGTELIKTGGSQYFKWGGRRIPIDTFKIKGGGTANIIKPTGGKPVSSYSSSYGGYGGSSSLMGSGGASFLSLFGKSYKPTSYKQSTIGGSSPLQRSSFDFGSSGGDVFNGSSGGGSGGGSSGGGSGGGSSGSDVFNGSSGGGTGGGRTGGGRRKRFYFPWLSFSPGGEQKRMAKSYVPQVKSRGKWKTVGKRMDRQSALSRASKGADLTTSRSIRIKPSNKPPQVTGIGGWGMRRYKFRPGKGANTFIEKTSFAIDTPTEKSGLSIAKLSKQMRWGISAPKKKTKRRKKK